MATVSRSGIFRDTEESVYNSCFSHGRDFALKSLGYIWGIVGVLLLLCFALYRLAPMAFELAEIELSALHWSALVFSIIYMAYAEGYKGFHKGFAPRVVVRASFLKNNPKPLHILLAPLFCMGYIHATRKRQLLSIGLTLMIICFIFLARTLAQPWRGILDAGVVVGLGIGILSICYFLALARFRPEALTMSPEVPGQIVEPKQSKALVDSAAPVEIATL
jgi:hypothetical protein